MIEVMSEKTVEGAVELHIQCFQDSFLTNMDRDVLRCMYENYIRSDLGCAYVYVDRSEVVGLVAGVVNASVYYNQMLKKRGAKFIWLTAKRVIRNPKLIISILRRSYEGFFRPDESDEAYRKANLEAIGVREDYRGTDVARSLADRFLEDVKGRGVREVQLGVMASNTRSKRFYEKIGLEHLRTLDHPSGEELHIYGVKFDEEDIQGNQ